MDSTPAGQAKQYLQELYDRLIGLADQVEAVVDHDDPTLWNDEHTLALHRLASNVDSAVNTLHRVRAMETQSLLAPARLVRPLRVVDGGQLGPVQ